ncbi:MAG: hypothetical protein M4D80_34380 [Myxococcota bacterium]|nr:hypothetical protein [Deltaproteobacteria bacterium]MDQ3340274.1 hypothetical protein [Myxococcota bacterium]
MEILFALVLIAAGILGASSLIVAKKPNAARIIDSLLPFQALIGAGALVLAIINLLRWGPLALLETTKATPFMGAAMLGGVLAGILLGFMFAIPLMGRLGAGQQRAAELAENLAPWQMLIGLVAAAAGVLLLLFRSGILPPNFPNNFGF